MELNEQPGDSLGAVARVLAGRVAAIDAAVQARATAELEPTRMHGRDEFREILTEVRRESVSAQIAAMEQDTLPERCPDSDVRLAQLAAQLGDPLSDLHWTYRAIHRQLWEESHSSSGPYSPEREEIEAAELSDFLFSYVDHISQLTAREYELERERLARGWKRRQAHVVHRLLAGEQPDTSVLDYDLRGTHVALVCWGAGAKPIVDSLAAATTGPSLIIELWNTDTIWGWFGDAPRLETAIGSMSLPAGTAVALGEELVGADGFRRSHEQAAVARRAAQAQGTQLCRYRDIALEALAARDENEARLFVARELRGLDSDGARARNLRATVEAYFATGHNAAAAAARLGVHEQTVANRLAAASQLLGHDIATRRAEIETALRLRAFLGS